MPAKREVQAEADRIDLELHRLANVAERAGLFSVCLAIERARGAVRAHMTEKRRQADFSQEVLARAVRERFRELAKIERAKLARVDSEFVMRTEKSR